MKPDLHLNRETWVLLVGCTLIVGLLASRMFLPGYLRWRRDAIAGAAAAIGEAYRAQTLSREKARIVETLARRRGEYISASTQLLGGPSRASAEAALAAIIRDAANNAGLQLSTILIQADTASDAILKAVRVRSSVTGDVRGLMSLLYAIETAPELLAIRSLSINQPEPGAPDDAPETLQVELTIEGLFLDSTSVSIR